MNAAPILANGSPESQVNLEEVELLQSSQIRERVSELQSSLSGSLPGWEDMLKTIHMQLSQDEALVHLLSAAEVGVICNGLARKKGVLLVKEASKKRTGKKDAPTVDDI